MSVTQQLRALLYKNVLLKRRSPISTVGMILLPTAVMLILVWIHSYSTVENNPPETHAGTICSLHPLQSFQELRNTVEKRTFP